MRVIDYYSFLFGFAVGVVSALTVFVLMVLE